MTINAHANGTPCTGPLTGKSFHLGIIDDPTTCTDPTCPDERRYGDVHRDPDLDRPACANCGDLLGPFAYAGDVPHCFDAYACVRRELAQTRHVHTCTHRETNHAGDCLCACGAPFVDAVIDAERPAVATVAQRFNGIPMATHSIEFARVDYMRIERASMHAGSLPGDAAAPVLRMFGLPIATNPMLVEGLAVCLGPDRQFLGLIDLREPTRLRVNGKDVVTRNRTLAYHDILALAEMKGTPTMIVHYPLSMQNERRRDRTVTPGTIVDVCDDMSVTIVHTDKA